MLGRRVKKIGKFNIKTPSDKRECCARGVVYLSEDGIVISDSHNKKLKLFTDNGQYLDELVMEGYPCDMCLVDNHTVAVAVYSPGSVCVVEVEDSKLSLSSGIEMPNDKNCYGIMHTDGRFVVSTERGDIYTVTPDNIDFINGYRKACYSIAQDPLTKDTLISVANETEGECAVSRLSDNHQYVNTELTVGIVWHAAGLDTDTEGNIYVCGRDSHNVVQMSGDGTHVRELLTASDGIVNPWGLAVRDETMLITTNIGCDVRVFKLY
ncbi:uncharacterized protein LOC110453062 [Mizuhopecten yessoensis]|uniref:uncharacterized protein LOC110453062 n=1 Tax=Mizuhopecten yessoensis TaxID=6573 RepID=UPI000B4599BD|nr:uncharacterized protein LOC110453062 [Mizuhopecten yessoensis]